MLMLSKLEYLAYAVLLVVTIYLSMNYLLSYMKKRMKQWKKEKEKKEKGD